jgi:hypothetical protein
MTLIDFQDAVTARNLDPNQAHAVYYADGLYANHTAVAARCPHAKLYGITVFGRLGKDIFACDCETGDLTVPQAVAWVAAQVRLGVPLICVYANLSRWKNEGLLAALEHYGHRIKRWVADYNNVPQIPSWADADQFAGGITSPVDRNVALENFFGGVVPAFTPHSKGRARFEGTVDLASGKVLSVHGLPGVGVHFAGPSKLLEVRLHVKVGEGGGSWRAA